jgi:hypothetical protein
MPSTYIDREECIGDSLVKLNSNFSGLDADISGLGTNITNVNTRVTNLSGQVYGSGSVLQVVYAFSNTLQTIASQNLAVIPSLNISIVPKKTNSKILIQATINSSATYVASFGVGRYTGPTWAAIGGNTNTNSTNAIATTFNRGNAAFADTMTNVRIEYVDTPTYTLGNTLSYAPGACSSWDNTLYNLFINNRNTGDMLSTSSITLTEIG